MNEQAEARRPAEYRIYVIELDDEVGGIARVRDRSPGKRADKPWIYVGYSAHTPEHRFEQHKSGVHDAPLVRKYGTKLRPRLYENAPISTTREEAERMERHWAQRLRRRGFGVWEGGLGPLDPGPRGPSGD